MNDTKKWKIERREKMEKRKDDKIEERNEKGKLKKKETKNMEREIN
jgi:hypothetical protein